MEGKCADYGMWKIDKVKEKQLLELPLKIMKKYPKSLHFRVFEV